MSKKPVIAIDGPAGAGKTSLAKGLAHRLGFLYIDSGAMYRCVGLLAERKGLACEENPELFLLLESLRISFETNPEGQRVFANGEDVTELIRRHEVSRLASGFSALPAVRKRLVALQRELGRDGGVVMEGRDIGTNVFPEAKLKIFLTASAEARAKRRFLELMEKGQDISFEQVLQDQIRRDESDTSRTLNPLAKAHDALALDTSDMTLDQVVEMVAEKARGLMDENTVGTQQTDNT